MRNFVLSRALLSQKAYGMFRRTQGAAVAQG